MADPEQAALARAAATGTAVEVASLRDEYSHTMANPDGTLTLSMATAPQRGRAADGSWAGIDTTLVRFPDGSVGPRVAAVGVRFSGGGEGAGLVRVDREGHRLRLGWPRKLPEPVLSGDAATYREVLPGVDLRLTATPEGFREVLVVRTPAAARSAALKRVRFSVAAEGLRVRGTAAGGMQASDGDGEVVFSSPPAMMWDSTGDAAAADAAGSGSATGSTTATSSATSSSASDSSATASSSAAVSTGSVSGRSAAKAVSSVAGVSAEGDGAESVSGSGGEPGSAVVDPVTQSRDLAPDGGQVDAGLAPDADDETALLPVEVAAGSVAVTPDPEVLTGADTVFPVFIDPSIGVNRSEWTMLSSAYPQQWKWTGDEGMGYCATYKGYWCGSGFKKRLFFEFTRSRLVGKEVLDATFRATEVWSMSCTASWVDLERVDGGISSATKWPGPASVDQLGDRKVAYGRGSACSPSAPPQPVEFHDNAAEPDENLTKTVKAFAAGKWSRLTLMLRAKDESDPNGWKRFKNDAVLSVVYIPIPAKPKPVGVRPNSSTAVDCSTDPNDPVTVDRTTPTVVGTPRVSAIAAKDPTQYLQVEFYAQRYNKATGAGTPVWSDYEPDSGGVAAGVTQSTKVKAGVLQDDVLYRLRARTQSHVTYRSKAYDRWSAYSSWCYFTVDSTAPAPPVITSTGVYQECTADACPATGGPGVAGAFTLAPAAGVTDVVKYTWRLQGDGASSKEISVTGKTAAVTVTPPLAGTYRLRVEAHDALRRGTPAYYQFMVAAPEGPVGAWSFAESGGTSAADATQSAVRHPLTLAGGAAFDARARRGDLPADQSADHSLGLNGSTGHAAASGPVLNHTTSFTVSAWAFLTDPSQTSTVVAQTADDDASTGFALYYSPGYRKWVFNWHWVDTATGEVKFVRSLAEVDSPATKVWTHLTGVYDTQAKTIQLYVNGRPQGAPVPLTGAVTTVGTSGAFQVGRAAMKKVAFTSYFTGLIDEVHAWQRLLTPEEIAEDAALLSGDKEPATALMASWSADVGTVTGGTTIPDTSAYDRGDLTLSTTGAA
ncbi:MAG: LamG domain-containing protein, partial [Actinomycetales bacterium]|nr:LamG domain-containing protein [Actinomycetales bacterium]